MGWRHLKLNVGCGGSKYAFYDLKCEVNCDLQKPDVKISNFVLSDIRSLPFRDKTFERVYAYNVLEHLSDPSEAIAELNRVGSEVLIRTDKVRNLANWFTGDHESITVENALKPFPKPIKWFVKVVRFPLDHSRTFQNAVHKTFPALRKLGLLDDWNYYQLK